MSKRRRESSGEGSVESCQSSFCPVAGEFIDFSCNPIVKFRFRESPTLESGSTGVRLWSLCGWVYVYVKRRPPGTVRQVSVTRSVCSRPISLCWGRLLKHRVSLCWFSGLGATGASGASPEVDVLSWSLRWLMIGWSELSKHRVSLCWLFLRVACCAKFGVSRASPEVVAPSCSLIWCSSSSFSFEENGSRCVVLPPSRRWGMLSSDFNWR